MKVLLCMPLLLFAVRAWADESTDRVAIGRIIAALNETPPQPDLFTADSDSSSQLERLWKGKRLSFRPRTLPTAPEPSSPGDRTSVTISHEPWGEATIKVPPMELINPRIVSRVIRFITNDVALVEGGCIYEVADGTRTTPLLLIMKREGDIWRIAALRLLALP
jgi:hypothetical protein